MGMATDGKWVPKLKHGNQVKTFTVPLEPIPRHIEINEKLALSILRKGKKRGKR
jgi:hypothetical protein